MKEKGVGVAGVVLDTTDEKGNQDEEAVKKQAFFRKNKSKISVPDTGYYYDERPSAGDFRIS